MKQDELIFEDNILFYAISQWKRPQLSLIQVHSELTSSYSIK